MKKKIYIALIAVFFCGIVICGIMLYTGYSEYAKGNQLYDDITLQVVRSAEPTVTSDAVETTLPPDVTNNPSVVLPTATQPPMERAPIQIDFDRLMEINEHIVGWLYCEGTVINYPVVKGTDNSYYLGHLIDGTKNNNGTLFIDFNSAADFSDKNTVLYGHHMKSGAMLASIVNYWEQEYFDEHPCLYLLTPTQNYKIELFSGYITPAVSETYTMTFEDDEAFLAYINTCMELSDFTSPYAPTIDDRLIVLSTCTYEFTNARYVLHGILTLIE